MKISASSENLPDRARQLLKSVFGFHQFRGQQAEIIQQLANGGDAVVLLPTGGGKSLCYQLPALLRQGIGVVVSPLIALMQDQVNALRQLGVRAAFLNSTLDYADAWRIKQQLQAGELDLIYIAPERLLNERTLQLFDHLQLALFAIDEAHCVSQWGHDFRPDYQQLSVLHRRYPGVPRVALTATADRRTQAEIVEQLSLQQATVYSGSFDRPNIRYHIDDSPNPRPALWRFLSHNHPEDAGIVYCLSRKRVEAVALWLQQQGRVALPYHAGMERQDRQLHQQRFLHEEGVIIVATIAFGMGIDKPDVRFVAHLNLPKSIEAYYQETGRAGRDGEPANAWMAYGLQDVITLRQMTQASDADDSYKRISHQKLEAMLGFCEIICCRRQALLGYLGETLTEPCGNCDNCLNPPNTCNATEDVQKALSCVYRTGQRFGVNYVIDVLTGKADPRIERNRHQHLSTFGIGTHLSATEWRSLFRQLIAQGLLEVELEHGTLRLSESCRPLLKGKQEIQLRKPRPKQKSSARRKTTHPSASKLGAGNQALYDVLRDLRLDLSKAHNIPPYMVFHDRTLKEMATLKPKTLDELRTITGVGEIKLARYGGAFLQVLGSSVD